MIKYKYLVKMFSLKKIFTQTEGDHSCVGSLGNFITSHKQLEKWLMAESNGERDSKTVKQNVL